MKISIREALLNRDDVMNYQALTTDWIIAQDDNSHEWSPEFIATGQASDKNSLVIFTRLLSIESSKNLITENNGFYEHGGARSINHHVKIWYNPELDLALLYFGVHADRLKYAEPIMEKVSAMSKDELEKLLKRKIVPFTEFT